MYCNCSRSFLIAHGSSRVAYGNSKVAHRRSELIHGGYGRGSLNDVLHLVSTHFPAAHVLGQLNFGPCVG